MQNIKNSVNQARANVKTGFSDIEKKINSGLFRSDAGVGEYFSYTNTLNETNGKIIVSPPNFFGIEGFVFDVNKDEEVILDNEITQHVVEDRTYISDNVASKPIIYKTGGYVGEIFVRQDVINEKVSIAQDKLGILSQYKVPFTASANKKINDLKNVANKNADYIKNVYKSGENILETFFGKNPAETLSRTDNAVQFFNYLSSNKIPCSISTGVIGYLKDMIVKNVAIRRERGTNVVSFDLTFEQVLFSSTKFDTLQASQGEIVSHSTAEKIKLGQGETIPAKLNTSDDLTSTSKKAFKLLFPTL